MLTKGRLALAAALLLGVTTASQAAGDDRSEHRGGIEIGPFGQCFVPWDCDPTEDEGYGNTRGSYGYGSNGFAYVPYGSASAPNSFAYAPYGFAPRYNYPRAWYRTR
jgi:hypothetical protein